MKLKREKFIMRKFLFSGRHEIVVKCGFWKIKFPDRNKIWSGGKCQLKCFDFVCKLIGHETKLS